MWCAFGNAGIVREMEMMGRPDEKKCESAERKSGTEGCVVVRRLAEEPDTGIGRGHLHRRPFIPAFACVRSA